MQTHTLIFCHIIFASYYNEFVVVQRHCELESHLISPGHRTEPRALAPEKNVVVDS